MAFIWLFCCFGIFCQLGHCIPESGNIENCEDDICLKDKLQSYLENDQKTSHQSFYKTIAYNNQSVIKALNQTVIEVKPSKSEEFDVSYNSSDEMDLDETTQFFDSVENITESINTTVKDIEGKTDHTLQTKETSQYVTEATSKYVPSTQITPTFNDYSHLLNITGDDNDDVCFCDLSMDECDINCCCDSDCGPNHWKVFTRCDEANFQRKDLRCYQNNFIFKNNVKLKVFNQENGLFCIAKNNLKSSLLHPNKGLIASLSTFNKILPKEMYSFVYKEPLRHKFEANSYKAESFVWILQNGDVKPFAVPVRTLGSSCYSKSPVKYLVDQVEKCSHKTVVNGKKCDDSNGQNIIDDMKNIIVIANPHFINKSLNYESVKVCQRKVCILPDVHVCRNYNNCTLLSDKGKPRDKIACEYQLSKVRYRIWHNGSEGIKKLDTFLYLSKVSKWQTEERILRTIEVQFKWVTPPKKVFRKSGNPGYLIGKPILTSKKGFVENVSGTRKDVMEWSPVDSNNWLDVLGSEKGICSPGKRIPVNFKENTHHSCLIELTKENFSKGNCTELQRNIFRLLLGEDLGNVTSETFFNKFVATFGNSKLEDIQDWVQILIDLFPVASTQVDFKFGHGSLTCKNIISDLVIDVAYSNVGSFLRPQAKILGVSFQFGKHKDFKFYCDGFRCETTTENHYFKLSSTVNFIDLTEPVIEVFAEPLGLEVKLPHDFFYPFFSSAPRSRSLDKFVSGLFCLTLFSIIW